MKTMGIREHVKQAVEQARNGNLKPFARLNEYLRLRGLNYAECAANFREYGGMDQEEYEAMCYELDNLIL